MKQHAGDYNIGHATSQQIAPDVVVRDPEVFEDPVFFNGEPSLTAAEIDHFKTQGFVIKRGLLAEESGTLERVVDHVWANVPRGILDRDDPATWLADPEARWTEQDAERVGLLTRGNWKMRSRGGVGAEAFLVDGIASHPRMLALASAFIGAPIKPVERVRGIYGVFPYPADRPGVLGPHADYMAAQLSAMVLVDEVPPRCGGFTVWPGSHLLLHPHWDTVHGGTIGPDRAEGFRLARDAVLREITPVELPGRAGDVVFWHPRLLHSAGINHSASLGAPHLRLIVPCDYQRGDVTLFDDTEFGPGATYQWWVDTRNFREDAEATDDNIWSDWVFSAA